VIVDVITVAPRTYRCRACVAELELTTSPTVRVTHVSCPRRRRGEPAPPMFDVANIAERDARRPTCAAR
jgi:hypothetical protein